LKRNYDQRLTEKRRAKKLKTSIECQGERQRFEAKLKGEPPKLRIAFGAWANALEEPPFGSGKYTWQLTLTFPFKMRKDKKMEEFMEVIQRVFKSLFFN